MIDFLEKKRWVSIILALLIAIEIFYFSSINAKSTGKIEINFIPIIYHFSVFFLLNFFLFVSIKGQNELKVKHLLFVLAISILYSLSDEFHQMFVPGRDASIFDILTDTSGIFISSMIYVYSQRKKPIKNNKI